MNYQKLKKKYPDEIAGLLYAVTFCNVRNADGWTFKAKTKRTRTKHFNEMFGSKDKASYKARPIILN